jgi:hypothetical protein
MAEIKTEEKTNAPVEVKDIMPSLNFNSYADYKNAKRGSAQKAKEATEAEREYWARVKALNESITNPPKVQSLTRQELVHAIVRRANIYINLNNRGERKEYVTDEYIKPALRALLAYFTNDPDFEKMGEHYSLKKGIMLRGDVGRGKTLMLKIFSNIRSREHISHEPASFEELHSYGWGDNVIFDSYPLTHFASCAQIARHYTKDGEKALEKFVRAFYAADGMKDTVKPFVFDDLGTERESMNYGNRQDVMISIMSDRYELFVEHGIKTHCTTNLMSGEDIEKQYGSRIRSRCKEMFNVIDLRGEDRRK